MAGRRNSRKPFKSRRRKWKSIFLFLLVIATVLGFCYFYRDYLFASVEVPVDAPVDEDPVTDIPDPGGEEPEPDPGDDEPADSEPPPDTDPPPPVPPENWLHIKDGDYLLALVTKQTYLGRYEPSDLVKVLPEMSIAGRRFQLRGEARDWLVLMWEAAKDDGITLTICSAYRSYTDQYNIFWNNVARHDGDEEKANSFSARPGQSEHQLGTTVDFGGTSYDWNKKFTETAPGRWLAENAHRFGFVMSYPDGTTHITGYIYEPWHFRYIGVEAAAEWKESGFVLSVFLEEQKPQYYLD